MSRLLELDEIKKLQIQMLEFFDGFCRENNITYFLSYGTLLGAIRHKGYIPWDDDIDVMVPRPEVRKMVKLFKSDRYKICTTENHRGYDFPYPRMIDTTTYSKSGVFAKGYGVNIDIYPIDGYPETEKEIKEYKNRLKRTMAIRSRLLQVRNLIYRILPINSFPLVEFVTLRQEQALSSVDYSTSSLVQVCSLSLPPFEKRIFLDKVEVEFENHMYYAPVGWHEFLKNSYGDYMQLPPENKRIPYHTHNNVYTLLD